jgi:hypothetical protein
MAEPESFLELELFEDSFGIDPEASVGTQDRFTAGVLANPSLAL